MDCVVQPSRVMNAFISDLCALKGSYINLRWRSLKATYRSYGCAELPKNERVLMDAINEVDTDWYVTCRNDAGYYMHAVDIDHDQRIVPHKTPDYKLITSPGRRQWIWLLDDPIESDHWLEEQRRLTKLYSGDKASYHPFFFARIPGTYNHKRHCNIMEEL